MQISELGFRRHRINLAHVPSLILFVDIIYVQIPRSMFVVFVMGHTDPRIPCDHMIMHRQYGRLFKVHPCYLYRYGKKAKYY